MVVNLVESFTKSLFRSKIARSHTLNFHTIAAADFFVGWLVRALYVSSCDFMVSFLWLHDERSRQQPLTITIEYRTNVFRGTESWL